MSYSLEDLTKISFKIIASAGAAKSDAMEAIFAAKNKNFDLAKTKIDSANQNIIEAEKAHFELIQKEAQGIKISVPLILMHAEDQLLCSQNLILIAQEIIELHKNQHQCCKK